ncbi:helix-turn-helix domain-containing protein [Methylobacterium sp. NFXW15]|uniref:helix-turn-helix domain-containing protein n=1 Tax=Methylobacterium sp. NFXW15 TaxID=2819512 RepID=UPI003CF48CD3
MQTALAAVGLPPALATIPPCRTPSSPVAEARSGFRRTVSAEEEIFTEGDRAGTFYKVVSGVVRTCRLLSDGRRQIDAFHLPGDIFGLEAGAEHRVNAEAVTAAKLEVYRREPRALAGDDGTLAREIVASMMKGLERAQDHMMLLGRKSARERIATFLVTFSRRMACAGTAVDLPMSRTDMADHLGLTVESVSRAVTQLEREGLIALPPNRRMVVLRDEAALAQLAE